MSPDFPPLVYTPRIMSYRSERLKTAGWAQVSPRMWKASWLVTEVDILAAEKIQDQVEAGGLRELCPRCGWPVSQVLRSHRGSSYVSCFKCANARITCTPC